jgi:hypothetical protein
MLGFRDKYKNGISEYYSTHSELYSNPHSESIKECVKIILDKINLNKDPILDLSAGSGEVTTTLKNYKINNIIGSDPYTHQLYHKNTGQKVYTWSFDDIINCCITDTYSAIICSYAMHLCDKSKLKLLCMELATKSPYLCIITPHKQPIINKDYNWNLVYHDKYKKTHVRIYQSTVL